MSFNLDLGNFFDTNPFFLLFRCNLQHSIAPLAVSMAIAQPQLV